MSVGAVLAVGVFLWVHSADLRNPAALAAAFDPAPTRTLFALGAANANCMRQGLGEFVGLTKTPAECRDLEKMLREHMNDAGPIGQIAKSMTEPGPGLYRGPGGTFTSVPPRDVRLARVRAQRCFETEGYSVGDRGLHSVTEQPREHDHISLPRYLAYGDQAARRVADAPSGERDAALVEYFKSRKTVYEVMHRFFGDPGLQVAAARQAAPQHQAAIALLRTRLADPGFAPALDPIERAEIEFLAADPQDFVSCVKRRGQKSKA
jgi:hypothetical protein